MSESENESTEQHQQPPVSLSNEDRIAVIRSIQHSDQTIQAFLQTLSKSDPLLFRRVLNKASERVRNIDWAGLPVDDAKTFSAIAYYVGLMALHAKISAELVRTNDPYAEDPELLAARETAKTAVAIITDNLEKSEKIRVKTVNRANWMHANMVMIMLLSAWLGGVAVIVIQKMFS